jgi:DNA-binding transcriptional regulator YhcF (GntR family)
MPTVIEVNCVTGQVTERELTSEEIAQREADYAAAAEEQVLLDAEQTARAEARQSAVDKLSALGLNENEIAALVGG